MIRSAPHKGELAVKASIDSSASKLIQHSRRKYSDGSLFSQGTSQLLFSGELALRARQRRALSRLHERG
jgi:high-affinity nickel permease